MTARAERAGRDAPGGVSDRGGPANERRLLGQILGSKMSIAQQADSVLEVSYDELSKPLGSTATGHPLLGDPAAGRAIDSKALEVSLRPAGEGRSCPVSSNVRQASRGGHDGARNLDGFSVIYELERYRGTLEVLLLLRSEGWTSKSRLRSQLTPREGAIERSLRGLLRLGLIELECEPAFPFSKRYNLTLRGRALVDAPLYRWHRLLSS
jgi:DNA-binding HxlR family transcriptional regulator